MGPCNYVFSVNHAGLKHDSLTYLISNKIIFFCFIMQGVNSMYIQYDILGIRFLYTECSKRSNACRSRTL